MLELYKKLISSKIFKDWKSRNKDSFLCSFVLINEPQFDFYNKDNTITSFLMKDEIEIMENEKIYNETNIKPLEISKIKSSEEKIISIIQKRNPGENFIKKMLILQNSGSQLWNVIFITSSTKMLNVKTDMNNKIISQTFESLTKFMKRVK